MSLLIVLAVSSVALGILLANSNSLKSAASKSAARATTERDRTRSALEAMTSSLASSWLSGQQKLSPEQTAFIEETISYYRQFAEDEAEDPEDQFWVANANRHLSQLQARLGQLSEAVQSLDRSVEMLERIPPEWESTKVLLERVKTLRQKSDYIHETGDVNKSLPVARQAVELARQLAELQPADVAARHQLADALGNLGIRLRRLNRLDESLLVQLESAAINESLFADSSPELRDTFKRQLGIKNLNLGNLLSQMRQYEESRDMLDKSLAIRRELVESEPDSARFRDDLGYVLDSQGGLAFRTNQLESAEAFYDDAIQIRRRLVEQFPGDESYRRNLANSLSNLSVVLNQLGKFSESEPIIRELISIAESGRDIFPDVAYYQIIQANGNSNLAAVIAERGQRELAIAFHDTAIDLLEELVEQSIGGQYAIRELESAICQRATALGYLDRHEDAIADWDAAIQVTRPEEVNTLRLCRATSVVKNGDIDAALNEVDLILAETGELAPEQRDPNIYYNSACVHSLISSRVEDDDDSRRHALQAIELLAKSIDSGFQMLEHMETDPELAPLHEYPEFLALLK
jgi:tetratricopeptide (TPR) repeat protein